MVCKNKQWHQQLAVSFPELARQCNLDFHCTKFKFKLIKIFTGSYLCVRTLCVCPWPRKDQPLVASPWPCWGTKNGPTTSPWCHRDQLSLACQYGLMANLWFSQDQPFLTRQYGPTASPWSWIELADISSKIWSNCQCLASLRLVITGQYLAPLRLAIIGSSICFNSQSLVKLRLAISSLSRWSKDQFWPCQGQQLLARLVIVGQSLDLLGLVASCNFLSIWSNCQSLIHQDQPLLASKLLFVDSGFARTSCDQLVSMDQLLVHGPARISVFGLWIWSKWSQVSQHFMQMLFQKTFTLPSGSDYMCVSAEIP